jgi:hypothetical protein
MYYVYQQEENNPDELIGKYKSIREAKRWGTFHSKPLTPLVITDEYGKHLMKKIIYTKKNNVNCSLISEIWEKVKETDDE